jgi:hypothetical protein
MNNEEEDKETRQERREKRAEKRKEDMRKHGKTLAKVYKDAVLKRLRG